MHQPLLEIRQLDVQSCDRTAIYQWMQQCRQHTLALFADVDHANFCQQAHPDFSPIGWHLGHIAYTESLWLLEHLAGMSPQFPDYRRLFAADTLPKRDRVNLPTLAEVQTYLETIRAQVFEYLETAPLETQSRLWLWLLQHESQHSETIAIVQALLKASRGQKADCGVGSQSNKGSRTKALAIEPLSQPPTLQTTGDAMVKIPAGAFLMGNENLLALDNERPVHRGAVNAFWLDCTPITCAQYAKFMQAGGYQNEQWWSAAGWNWLQASPVTQPLYWQNDSAWAQTPVCGVNWYEADAYARFVGKRLPTEAEWEKAIRQQNDGLDLQVGLVWEWTTTWFDGYPGFTAYPYRGYSQAYFDQQHRVLRGSSWATQPWARRATFRNWYHPHVREIFAGFRCAQDDA